MAKRTLTKLLRAYVNNNNRIAGYTPPQNKEIQILEYKGIKMYVPADSGQYISPKREYLRRKKALEEKTGHPLRDLTKIAGEENVAPEILKITPDAVSEEELKSNVTEENIK